MSYKLYDIMSNGVEYEAYTVKVNGIPVAIDNARVSAIPFNRRWPGHQRQIEQSELVNFLSLATNEPLDFEITAKEPFENVVIRPLSLGIQPVVESNTIKFTIPGACFVTVEPYGRNNAFHIFADPMPEYDVDFDDPNTIYFGKGVHKIGEMTLKSNQTVFIDEGALVYGSFRAVGEDNIRILGRGILDNSHNHEIILWDANVEDTYWADVKNNVRRHTIFFEYCNNIRVDGITIRDSLVYNMFVRFCFNSHVSNVKTIGCWRYNSDGLDFHSCINTLVENCFVRTYDDSICIKGHDETILQEKYTEAEIIKAKPRVGKDIYKAVYNFTVKNCVVWNDWGRSLEIGAETCASEMYNILFENCDVIHATYDVMDCQTVNYGYIHGVKYRDIRVELDDTGMEPVWQRNDKDTYAVGDPDYNPPIGGAYVYYHKEYSADSTGGTKRGKNWDFLYEDIKVFGRYVPKFVLVGYDEEHGTDDVTIRRVYHNGVRLSEDNPINLQINEFCRNIKVEY